MAWSALPHELSGYGWLSKKMTVEAKKLRDLVAEVEEARAAADELAKTIGPAYAKDRLIDRTPLLVAQAKAVEAEIKVRRRLAVWYHALRELVGRREREANGKLREVERTVRARLNVPEGVPIPTLLFANDPEYYAARTAAEPVGFFDSEQIARRMNDDDLSRAREQSQALAHLIKTEPNRITQQRDRRAVAELPEREYTDAIEADRRQRAEFNEEVNALLA